VQRRRKARPEPECGIREAALGSGKPAPQGEEGWQPLFSALGSLRPEERQKGVEIPSRENPRSTTGANPFRQPPPIDGKKGRFPVEENGPLFGWRKNGRTSIVILPKDGSPDRTPPSLPGEEAG